MISGQEISHEPLEETAKLQRKQATSTGLGQSEQSEKENQQENRWVMTSTPSGHLQTPILGLPVGQ